MVDSYRRSRGALSASHAEIVAQHQQRLQAAAVAPDEHATFLAQLQNEAAALGRWVAAAGAVVSAQSVASCLGSD